MSSVPEDETEALQALSVCRGTFDGLAAAAIFGKDYEVQPERMDLGLVL